MRVTSWLYSHSSSSAKRYQPSGCSQLASSVGRRIPGRVSRGSALRLFTSGGCSRLSRGSPVRKKARPRARWFCSSIVGLSPTRLFSARKKKSHTRGTASHGRGSCQIRFITLAIICAAPAAASQNGTP